MYKCRALSGPVVKHDLKMELFMRNCNLICSLMVGLM